MRLVDTYHDLPNPKTWNGCCGVYRALTCGPFVTHRRGIYLTMAGLPWELKWSESAPEWQTEVEAWRMLGSWPTFAENRA